ncbi:hypothetical protein [Aeoliella mucimassa]|uniref:Secreted protein n=1 Tax=Aeoliella mucimassa TaxID=2527972 RepID=A0A518AHI4_9BACT|nr:hypothetical protein [Aeoliella mucimassa]QDU54144.1 hypothetical protein Pan181_03240 [Aeoliella mucimassa]
MFGHPGRLLASSCLLFLTTLTAAASAAEGDERYVVQFAPSGRVGQRYNMQLTAQQQLKRIIRSGEVVLNKQDSTVKIEFEATVEILAVNERKQETKRHYVVHKAVATMGDQQMTIVEPETEMTAEANDGEPRFVRSDGRALSQAAQQLLPRILLFDTDEVTTNDVFGSDTPRKVGDEWQGEPKALLAMLGQEEENIQAEQIKSRAKLASATPTEKGVLLDILLHTELALPLKESPMEGADPVSASVVIDHRVHLYEDSDHGPEAQSTRVATFQVLKGKVDSPLEGQTFDGTNLESQTAKYEQLPDAN